MDSEKRTDEFDNDKQTDRLENNEITNEEIIYVDDLDDDYLYINKNNQEEINEKELENRLDLRNEEIFTIDGEDAKDLDDAVRVYKNDDGNYMLDVHIADVSYYVTENSLLDKYIIYWEIRNHRYRSKTWF